MASKIFDVPALGKITVYKRKGVKRLSIRFNGQELRVSQPSWMPYKTGLSFVLSQKKWIENHRPTLTAPQLKDGDRIGKTYILRIKTSTEVRTRIKDNQIFIFCPTDSNSLPDNYFHIAKRAIYRALKKESETLLGQRLQKLALDHKFNYKDVFYKSMKSRWGSCNNNNEITLNIYLLMLPWELIDYVLIHELSHTVHLNHAQDFWDRVESHLPNYKELRKELKFRQASIMALR